MRSATSPTLTLESALRPVLFEDRRANMRYPLNLAVNYVATRGRRTLGRGQGFTLNLSRTGVLFESSEPVPPGQRVELRIAWPVSLNGLKDLNLWAQGRTIRSDGRSTAVQILHYEFRVRGGPSAVPTT